MRAPELDELIPQLRDPDPGVRSSAAGALGALGRDGIDAITPLLEACRDEDMYVRGEAAHSLCEIAGSLWNAPDSAAWPPLEAGVPVLIALLDDPWLSVRCSAMSVLQRLGPLARPALPRLRRLLVEDDPVLTAHPEGYDSETELRFLREEVTETIGAIAGSSDAEPATEPGTT